MTPADVLCLVTAPLYRSSNCRPGATRPTLHQGLGAGEQSLSGAATGLTSAQLADGLKLVKVHSSAKFTVSTSKFSSLLAAIWFDIAAG